MKNLKEKRYSLFVPLLIILCLMVVMVLYTSRLISSVAVTNIREVGEDRISSVAAQLDNYLESTRSALWVTADTVDFMLRNGSTNAQIEDYIVEETENQKQQFDENYTGFYAYIRGEYLDGLHWAPPEDYDPVGRDWYQAAVRSGTEAVIVPPYVDAQTNDVVITITRQISIGGNVVSLDVTMNRIQSIMAETQIKGKGYGFIVDDTGMVIAHMDESKKGESMNRSDEQRAFLESILKTDKGNFETVLDGQKSTVFVTPILDQWHVVIAVGNDELYAEVWQQMTVNILICAIIFILIALFYYVGYRNEKSYSSRMEEMKMEEQQQAYETKMLKLAKEAADQANKAKSSFLAEMSHEIRTPINAVLGMNEMIARECGEALEAGADARSTAAFNNVSRYAANIESAGNSLLSIINDILDFSKIEAGKLEIVRDEYQLSSVINDVSNMVFFKAEDKGLEFSVDVDERMPDGLYGDEVRIRQVITNLLSNAVKYTDSGSIHMSVRGEPIPGDADGITLVISVRDTGIGIRQEDMDRLFDKFERVDLNRNSTVEGTGLGLAITHSLMEKMGGEISVQSVYGEGSAFTVRLPQKVVSREPVGDLQIRFDRNARGVKTYETRFHAPDARVLVVDDTRMNLSVAVGLLKKTAMQVDTAASGAEAVELAKATDYDLILMDQRMPGMDGTQALRLIRAQGGANADVPVICLTADAVIGARDRYIAEGFTDYITKPIDSQALERMMLRYIPKDKVTMVRCDAQGTTADGGAASALYDALRSAGMRPEEGLRYCQGDKELYGSLLWEYANEAEDKARKLRRYYAEKDWKNYAIIAHAIKSTSRSLGATSLSAAAASAEAAADAGDDRGVELVHDDMLSRYAALSRVILEQYPGHAPARSDDEEIIEFMPEA